MVLISNRRVKQYFSRTEEATKKSAKGKLLEDLVCYVFGKVPGISVTSRNEKNAFSTEEIDVAFWNEKVPNGFIFLDHVILVECKNWSSAVGCEQVSWFDSKLRNRGLSFGILIAANGITGDQKAITDAHSVIATALRESRKLIVISKEDLLAIRNTDDLVLMVKRKLCELAVNGTIFN